MKSVGLDFLTIYCGNHSKISTLKTLRVSHTVVDMGNSLINTVRDEVDFDCSLIAGCWIRDVLVYK